MTHDEYMEMHEAAKTLLDSYTLPCDVKLPPATIIRAGCSLRTLLVALDCRKAAPKFVTPTPPPYDDVFRDGVEWLNGQ